VRSHKKFGQIDSAILTFIGYKATPEQTSIVHVKQSFFPAAYDILELHYCKIVNNAVPVHMVFNLNELKRGVFIDI